MNSRLVVSVLAVWLTACGVESSDPPLPGTDAGESSDAGGVPDAGRTPDAGGVPDAGPPPRCVTTPYRDFRSLAELQALAGCREVTGDLDIAYIPNPDDLSPLVELEVVKGGLYLHGMKEVTHLDALRSLRRVEGRLHIAANARLARVDGLSSLEFVRGELRFQENPSLEAIEGLGALTRVDGSLTFLNNPQLVRVSGFDRLEEVENLYFTVNPRLATLADMPALTTVSDRFSLEDTALERLTGFEAVGLIGVIVVGRNPVLSQVNAFANVVSLHDLSVYANDRLASLTGLNRVARLEGSLRFEGNPLLSQFNALRSTRRVRELFFARNPVLNLEAFARLEQVDYFTLVDMEMTSLEGFSSLFQVGYNLVLRRNHRLFDLKGLDALRSIGESAPDWNRGLLVVDNQGLRSLHGLGSLNLRSVSFTVENNPNLERWGRMDKLTSVGGKLTITSNPKLQSLEGLERLTSAGAVFIQGGDLTSLEGLNGLTETGDLTLKDLPRLQTLRGLDSLGRLSHLRVTNCASLKRLTGLEALRFLDYSYAVFKNPQLPMCEAENLLQRLRANGYTGSGVINDNGGTDTCP